MYWSSSGWKVPAEKPTSVDYEYARSQGYIFETAELTHRQAIARNVKAVKYASQENLRDSYIASLSRRILHIRPGLPAYFESLKYRKHWFNGDGNQICRKCGMFRLVKDDLSASNFARYKWGTYSRFPGIRNAFILERIADEQSYQPLDADWKAFKNLLQIAQSQNSQAKASDIVSLWKNVIPSNKQEREVLFESLISIGLLVPSRISQKDYDRIPVKSNWSDKAALWRGDDAIDLDLLQAVFGITTIDNQENKQ